MQFWIVKPFKAYEGDKLVAAYTPGLSYRLRPGNDRLAALLNGGKLPGPHSLTVEEPDLTQREYQPGEEVPGWLNEGRATLMAPANAKPGGVVSGTAEAKEG